MNFSFPHFIQLEKILFEEIINQYEQNDTGKFILLIFLLFLYLLLSAALNAYKIYVNVTFSPTARSFMDFLLNPFFNIYYLLIEKDFHNNYIYFAICEIICIIIDFSFYIFNEYVILSCCGLEFDTGDEIHRRANNEEINALDECEEDDTSTE